MRKFQKHLAVILLFAASLLVIPKELVHELSCHRDTVDVCGAPTGLPALSTVHHHCDLLQFFISPFLKAFVNYPAIHYMASDFWSVEIPADGSSLPAGVFEIRGPPLT